MNTIMKVLVTLLILTISNVAMAYDVTINYPTEKSGIGHQHATVNGQAISPKVPGEKSDVYSFAEGPNTDFYIYYGAAGKPIDCTVHVHFDQSKQPTYTARGKFNECEVSAENNGFIVSP